MPQPNKVLSTPTLLLVTCFSLFSCAQKSDQSNDTKPAVKDKSTKFTQYYVKGEQLYLTNCSNCHQKDGTGLGLLFPPLNQSDYLQNTEEVICLMRHGKNGEIIVNGKSFNKEMKGIPSLTDLEIAEIATYIYNTWGQERGIVDVKEVSAILGRCEK
jgi:cytochrome c551